MIIKNGTVIDPARDMIRKADLWLEDGLIREISEPGILAEDGECVIDASGLIVAPGLVDTHVHFRDPGNTEKEDLHTGALAAAAGGFTTVICMANVDPKMDSVEELKKVLARAGKEKIHVCQAANVTMGMAGRELVPMEELSAAGAAGFTDDGKPILDEKLVFEAMKNAAALGQPISLHEEDPAFIAQNGINRGRASAFFGIDGSPAMAEDVLVARDCMLALHSGADVVIQHISSGNSIALVRNAKALGAHIHAEATPHHFTLTEDAVIRHGSMAKMNPPLRTEADQLAIIEGLKDGTVDLIAT
ncbi:MAG: dihydroorotase, partial [Lachnospiraceae bacterium]